MILVYFNGLGEWFIRDGHSVKLAITRTTKEPYRDPMQHTRIETYCPDYDEWLGLDKDNEENFTEWEQLHESTRNTGNTLLDDLYDFDSKDHKYDGHLGGIFVRDPNVEGDVFNTDGLRCWGADYVDCPEIKGVFKLNPDDEKHFRLTNKDPKSDWEEFKKVIKELLPCSHPDSVFVKMVNEGKLSNIDAEHVYFEIKDQQHHDFFGKSTPIARPNVLDFVSMDEMLIMEKNKEAIYSTKYKDFTDALGLLNEPSRQDDWFDAISDMTHEFFKEAGKIPNETQAWVQLVTNPPKGYNITAIEKNKETILNMPGISRSLDRRNFTERWGKYTEPKTKQK